MSDWLTILFMIAGGGFAVLAAAGIVRLPDLYTRMQAATKASSLGVACIMVAAALHFGDLGVTTRSALVIAFLWLTAPVAAHMIGRAAYQLHVPQWEGTVIDELRGHHDIFRSESDCVRPNDRAVPPDFNS